MISNIGCCPSCCCSRIFEKGTRFVFDFASSFECSVVVGLVYVVFKFSLSPVVD